MKHEDLVSYLKAARPQVDDQTAAAYKPSALIGHYFSVVK